MKAFEIVISMGEDNELGCKLLGAEDVKIDEAEVRSDCKLLVAVDETSRLGTDVVDTAIVMVVS